MPNVGVFLLVAGSLLGCMACTGFGINGRANHTGSNAKWVPLGKPVADGLGAVWNPPGKNVVYAGGRHGTVLKCDARKKKCHQVTGQDHTGTFQNETIMSIAGPPDESLLWVSGTSLWKYTAGSQSWNKEPLSGAVNPLLATDEESSLLFVAVDGGRVYFRPSHDTTAPWAEVSDLPVTAEAASPRSMLVIKTGPDLVKLYVNWYESSTDSTQLVVYDIYISSKFAAKHQAIELAEKAGFFYRDRSSGKVFIAYKEGLFWEVGYLRDNLSVMQPQHATTTHFFHNQLQYNMFAVDGPFAVGNTHLAKKGMVFKLEE